MACGMLEKQHIRCSVLWKKHLQVVKASQRNDVLQECHGNVLGSGHFGRDKTLSKIQEHFYWQGMVKDVQFCLTCDKCQRANRLDRI